MKISVNGHPAYVYTGARDFIPEQPSVVFIHGNGLDHSVWLLQSRYFSHHGRNVLAVDMPGHGRSGGAPLESITDMADWIVDMLDAAGVDKAMVVGHSMGSLVAMETAARHPDRVSKLALIATASPMPVSDPLLNAARENKHDAFDMINLWGHSQYGQMGGNQAPGMWMSGSAIRLLERSGPGVLFAGLNACNEYKHGMESAAKVQCPTLLVLGSLDVMTPARVARKLEQVIPDVRSEVLNNCGHLIMAEKPNQLLDLLVDFLD